MSLYLGDIPIANDGLQRLTGEIGDIGIAPFGIDESLNLRRYLNGQIISQTQFEAFTNKVKSAIALYPNLAATEENWQAEVTASVLGQCGKFVVDDEAGTIRLPKVVNINGLQDLALIGGIKAESLPNITGSLAFKANAIESASAYEGAFAPIASTGRTSTALTTTGSSATYTGRFNASLSSTAYQDNAPVQQEAVHYPYFIQVATGIEETLPAIREYGINTPFFFGWSMYSENAPYNASLLASQGQYNASNLYPDLWTQLTGVELNTSLNVGDTIEIGGKAYVKRGLPVVLSTDTVTDYDFVVNQNDQTFRLPLLNGEENLPGDTYEIIGITANGQTFTAPKNGFVDFQGYATVAGSAVQMFTTNPPRGFRSVGHAVGNTPLMNLFVKKGAVVIFGGVNVDFSNSSTRVSFCPAVGNGTLYYYVGDTVQDASLINAGGVLSDVADLKQTTLRTDQITNCITEIPQDIKLELNNGTLTLKAGSKVYVPNGFEQDGTTPKFDTLTITEDKTVGTVGSVTGPSFLLYDYTNSTLIISNVPTTASGESLPSGFSGIFYNTTTNIISGFSGGTSDNHNYSLTIGLYTRSSGVPTSIDQIFNGFGYMGSTVFALPGVKGLVPNGRNVDGTLKNKEFTTDSVWLGQTAYNTNKATLGVVSDMKALVYVTDANVGYDDSDNKNKIVSNGTYWEGCFAGAVSVSDMKFTSVKPKLPFRAVDRNDSSWIAAQAMPSDRYIDLTLGASGSAYTAPANGWFESSKMSGTNNAVASAWCYENSYYKATASTFSTGNSGIPHSLRVGVKKGQKLYFLYTVTGQTNYFRFIYAEGEN